MKNQQARSLSTMNSDQLYELYQDLKEYVGWTEVDAQRVRSHAPLITPHLDELIDDFYAEIQRHPAASKVVTGEAAQIERLKNSLHGWLEDLLAASCDRDYAMRRWKVGWRHVEIGLAQVYTNTAMSRLRAGLMRILAQASAVEASDFWLVAESLNKLIDLDLAIIEDAYQAEYVLRQDRVQRLATIGELAGGVAHELRNPLGIIRNAAYFLRTSQQELSDDARDAFGEMERGLATCNRLVTELLDYVREPKRVEADFPLATAIDEVLARMTIPAAITVLHSPPPPDAVCRADRGQILQILHNLIRNAIEAMPGGGILTLSISYHENNVVVDVTDSGQGIAAIDLEKVFEPLFSRKTKGVGLGLAVSRRYAELNRGQLEVQSDLGRGATFRLTLPRSGPCENQEES